MWFLEPLQKREPSSVQTRFSLHSSWTWIVLVPWRFFWADTAPFKGLSKPHLMTQSGVEVPVHDQLWKSKRKLNCEKGWPEILVELAAAGPDFSGTDEPLPKPAHSPGHQDEGLLPQASEQTWLHLGALQDTRGLQSQAGSGPETDEGPPSRGTQNDFQVRSLKKMN